MTSLLRNRSRRAIFLCYHSVAPAGPRYLTVSAELFERQLSELARARLARRRPRRAERAWRRADASTPTVFLTFDDGFLDNHATVLPLLREHGLRAFVFVLPPLVDSGRAAGLARGGRGPAALPRDDALADLGDGSRR